MVVDLHHEFLEIGVLKCNFIIFSMKFEFNGRHLMEDENLEQTEINSLNHPNSSQSSPLRDNSLEREKLKAVIRQLYRDKQEIKDNLEKECQAHDDDINRLVEEKKIIKSEISRLQEGDGIDTQPSPEADAHIYQLEQQAQQASAQLLQIRKQILERQRQNQLLQKQVDQYKMTLCDLEDELSTFEADKETLASQKTTIHSLEEELRSKARTIKELETNQICNSHDLIRTQQLIDSHNNRNLILSLSKVNRFQIAPSVDIPSVLRESYKEIEEANEVPSDSSIDAYFRQIPEKIEILTEENENLQAKYSMNKEKFEKLQATMPVEDEHAPPPEKMRETLVKLVNTNKQLTEKIAKMTEIANQQHTALQKLMSKSATNEEAANSLRHLISSLGTCPENERRQLASKSDEYLDMILGSE